MPIEKEFKFNDEADFVARFLDPLLRRLGFSVVIPYHGRDEFGRDLIFAEIDRFRQVAYHGLQAKYVDSIHQGDSEGLIHQCEQAFRHPFTNPSTGEQHYITTFIIANGGSLTDNARENFFRATEHKERIGQVRLLDGRTLLSLDRWASFGTVQQVGETLSGLLIELQHNRPVLAFIADCITKHLENKDNPIPSARLRIGALSHYLHKPLVPNLIDSEYVFEYVRAAEDEINGMLDRLVTIKNKETCLNSVVFFAGRLQHFGVALESAINKTLKELGPLAAL